MIRSHPLETRSPQFWVKFSLKSARGALLNTRWRCVTAISATAFPDMFQCINKLYISKHLYPMIYPLIFPNEGFQLMLNFKQRNGNSNITMVQFYYYKFSIGTAPFCFLREKAL